ncbi:hypothetical protein BH09ACT4_BH09ACT4_10450 [soil metagenome]
MASKRDSDVDPRFDPVFQRGYDPAVHPAPRPRPRPQPLGEERREAPRLETEPSNPVDAKPPDVISTGSITDISTGSITDIEPDLEPLPRNPFRLALLLASLAALAAAGGLLWNRVTSVPYYYGSPSSDTWSTFLDGVEVALLPALTTGGLIGLTLWLALGALRKRDGD